MTEQLSQFLNITDRFDIEGKVLSVSPYGDGHISITYLVTTDKKRYILQKINTSIFRDVQALMNNICAVTEYLESIGVETQKVIYTRDGERYLELDGFYRVYSFVENTVTYQTVTDAEIFKNTGEAFGAFQNHLAKFDASVLSEIIPDFHNTPKRFEAFERALSADVCKRAAGVKDEIDFVLSHRNNLSLVVDGIKNGEIPVRVTHNDTKLNNILMDAETHRARAIIDLDTIMPGSMLYDFGDSIRFGASTAAEDEVDLDKVHFDISLYEAYASGFCPEVKESITEREEELMPYSAYLMTIECGIRFLTDYLSGDTYFSVKYPEHNLVRARTQFKLASEQYASLDEMAKITRKYCK